MGHEWRVVLVWLVIVAGLGGACTARQDSVSLTASEMSNARQGLGFSLGGEEVEGSSPTLRASVGQSMTINLENAHGRYYGDSNTHDFAVVVDKDVPRGEWVYLWESRIDAIEPGETGSVTFTPDTVGTYYYVCTLPGHVRHGMWGEFVVRDA